MFCRLASHKAFVSLSLQPKLKFITFIAVCHVVNVKKKLVLYIKLEYVNFKIYIIEYIFIFLGKHIIFIFHEYFNINSSV